MRRFATIFVDADGIVHGGSYDGMAYNGELAGTRGADVIVGTDGDDLIGQKGNDFIDCGEGEHVGRMPRQIRKPGVGERQVIESCSGGSAEFGRN